MILYIKPFHNYTSTVKLNKRRLESNAMLYSPVHIKLSIAHFDFISDYTMMLDRCQREWHNPQSSHNTAQDNMNIGVYITRGKVSFCLLSFRGQKPILCMIYLRKFSQLLPQEDWEMVITHVLIEIPLKKIFLRTKTIFIILDLAHLNQRFSSWHGSPLQLCQLGMVIVDHNGESSSSWDVWLWLTVCINGGNEMATKDPNTRITLNSLQSPAKLS